MISKKLNIFCVTNKEISPLKKNNYTIVGVGKATLPDSYLNCSTKQNIFYKEEFYSELTFHYWYWKNMLDISNKEWIGFCQKRRFWIKSASKNIMINKDNLNQHLLVDPEEDWENYESLLCTPINVNNIKKMKILKRGWRSLLKKPSILFDESKQTLALHFDMHHGYGNLNKAIELLETQDRNDFFEYVNSNTKFNAHIMFISKNIILDKWFNTLFSWLERCEEVFGFKNLKGYDTLRLYAYLSERYLSFWFKKYTTHKEQPWVFIDN